MKLATSTMPNITHGATRPRATPRKLLFVRQPVRSVRRRDPAERGSLGLTIGVIVAVGVVALVWLIGHLGYRLGFAPLVRVPELLDAPGGGLATGTMVVVSIPRAIFSAGLAQPLWLMIGFALIALPAGGLGAAKPAVPGGPRPKRSIQAIAAAGAVVSIASGAGLIWWTSSPVRNGMLRVLPSDPAQVGPWHADIQTVAGLDVLALVTAALWVVLVLRLPIPIWLRAIAGSAAFFTLVVVTVAMAISSTAATQIGAARSLCEVPGAPGARLLLGSTPQHIATLGTSRANEVDVDLRSRAEVIAVHGGQSIADFLAERGREQP